jgi:DNA-binding protein HU-beta
MIAGMRSAEAELTNAAEGVSGLLELAKVSAAAGRSAEGNLNCSPRCRHRRPAPPRAAGRGVRPAAYRGVMSTSTKEHRMTKHELARQIAADAGITAGQAASVVDAAFDAITGELAAGRDVAIAGFGKFSVSERAAREGRNPATGETIQIAASRAAKFSAAAALKKQLNS